jgi:hypothetical protein
VRSSHGNAASGEGGQEEGQERGQVRELQHHDDLAQDRGRGPSSRVASEVIQFSCSVTFVDEVRKTAIMDNAVHADI